MGSLGGIEKAVTTTWSEEEARWLDGALSLLEMWGFSVSMPYICSFIGSWSLVLPSWRGKQLTGNLDETGRAQRLRGDI